MAQYPMGDKTYDGIRDDRPIDKESGNDWYKEQRDGGAEVKKDLATPGDGWVEGSLPEEKKAVEDPSPLEKVGDAIKGAATSVKDAIGKTIGK